MKVTIWRVKVLDLYYCWQFTIGRRKDCSFSTEKHDDMVSLKAMLKSLGHEVVNKDWIETEPKVGE